MAVLDGRQFSRWLEAVAGTTHVGRGARLDPFATSARHSGKWSGWLELVKSGKKLPVYGGGGNQIEVDLTAAGLLERQAGTLQLTQLGESVLAAWKNLNIDDESKANEIARCVVLAKLGIQQGVRLYLSMYAFWKQVRDKFDVETILDSPEQLYSVSYLNQTALGFNPFSVISSLEAHNLDPMDWSGTSPALTPNGKKALETLHVRVNDAATRVFGRRRFCQAMEILCRNEESRESAVGLVRRWSTDDSE